MITAIVFDCYGVLYEDAFKQLVDRHAQADASRAQEYFAVDTAFNHGFISEHVYYERLASLSGVSPTEIRRQMTDTTVFSRPVAAIIESLRPKYQIGLLSNSERGFLDRFLSENNAAHLFDVVLGSSETAFVKPQREIFEILGQKLGVPLSEILFIDDSPTNTAAARSYGLPAITYQNPHQLRSELPV